MLERKTRFCSICELLFVSVSLYPIFMCHFIPSVYHFIPSLGHFIPSVYPFFPSLGHFIPSLCHFILSVNNLIPSLCHFIPSLSVPSLLVSQLPLLHQQSLHSNFQGKIPLTALINSGTNNQLGMDYHMRPT